MVNEKIFHTSICIRLTLTQRSELREIAQRTNKEQSDSIRTLIHNEWKRLVSKETTQGMIKGGYLKNAR